MKGRVTWAQRIGGALQHDGFTLLAQPIVELATGSTSQYELLLRMRDEHGDQVLPGSFLYIAERLGMVQEIDRWVTTQAINLLAEHRDRGEELTLEVNLSGLSIGDPQLLALVSRELKRTGVRTPQPDLRDHRDRCGHQHAPGRPIHPRPQRARLPVRAG